MPVSRIPPTPASPLAAFPPPYWAAPRAALYLGDVRACLRAMPARSVHCCVTSPPYWGLRSYLMEDHPDKSCEIGAEPSPDCGTHGQAQCGACFVCAMVGVFREVYRVLRDDGTCWLNLGDSYTNGIGESGRNDLERKYGPNTLKDQSDARCDRRTARQKPLPSGNIVGIPWRVALALQADGWVLRQDIIWYSPNKMPESVTNRCTKSHEHIFLLAKGEGYYFDAVAIEEEMVSKPHAPVRVRADRLGQGAGGNVEKPDNIWGASGYKNKRDVWVVPSQGYPGAHFATFSPRLITPCILAGTSEHGACAACGAPWERVVVKERADSRVSGGGNCFGKQDGGSPGAGGHEPNDNYRQVVSKDTAGWRKMCGCCTDEVVPCVVLDPFVGSGTSVATALLLGRAGVGVDLSEVYLRENAVPRLEAALVGEKVGRKPTVAVPAGNAPESRRMRGAE